MIIYSDHITPRLEYVCSFLFGEVLGQEYFLTNNPGDIEHSDQQVLVYSRKLKTNYFTIIPHSLLFENEIKDFVPEHNNEGRETELFPNEEGHLGFDILSAIFYMISRYEEYLKFEADAHNRFAAQNSLAFNSGFLLEPIVNIWISKLIRALQNFYPSCKFNLPKSTYLFSIDIDIAWDIKNKGFVRTSGAFLRSLLRLDFSDICYRINVLRNKLTDRFDAFQIIMDQHIQGELMLFILLADRTKYDRNISFRNPAFVNKIKELSGNFSLGIHPSYFSTENSSLLKKEKARLEKIINKEVFSSRQHYLRLRFPDNYRLLLEAGVTEDYSMLFADQPGFRAGTSYPFDWYDLSLEKHTELRIYPSCLMDRTLKDYLKFNQEEANSLINEMLGKINKYGGVFIPIWHNDSIMGKAEWEGWDEVYSKMLKKARQL